MTPDERSTRARLAANRRHHPDDPETERLAADFKADRLAAYIRRVVDEAPLLSPEQRSRLAVLLRGCS
jgi:hypothetical protein